MKFYTILCTQKTLDWLIENYLISCTLIKNSHCDAAFYTVRCNGLDCRRFENMLNQNKIHYLGAI